VRAFIGVGSNLGDRARLIADAVAALRRLPRTQVLRVSSLRETDPVDYLDQPRFLNGAIEVETELEPRPLLEALLSIEHALGRDRATAPARGPRPIDLDLLVYGDSVLDEPDLCVPHARLHERQFVLEPLAELDPGLVVPGRGTVETLLAKLHSNP
jgi:2-amino-4-hydroxy-6-hydroxymethyldihydropteridine diphosphokinase